MMELLLLLQEGEEPTAQAGGLSSRAFVLGLMVALPAICTILVVIGGLRLRGILKKIKVIQGPRELDILRRESAIQGAMARLVKPMLGIANLLFVVDLFLLDGPLSDLIYSIGPSLVCIAVSLPFRRFETQVNELGCANPELERQWLEIRQE
jgi:hypothetical protein